MFETLTLHLKPNIFISALQKDLLSADLHGQVHARVMLVMVLLEIMADLYWFSYSDI